MLPVERGRGQWRGGGQASGCGSARFEEARVGAAFAHGYFQVARTARAASFVGSGIALAVDPRIDRAAAPQYRQPGSALRWRVAAGRLRGSLGGLGVFSSAKRGDVENVIRLSHGLFRSLSRSDETNIGQVGSSYRLESRWDCEIANNFGEI